jgi:hypothetical protein
MDQFYFDDQGALAESGHSLQVQANHDLNEKSEIRCPLIGGG